MPSPILLQAHKDSHHNLQQFNGDLSQDINGYIRRIENIGALTQEPDETFHILLKEKLSGQAERWFKDNQGTLDTWSKLQTGLRQRFQQPTTQKLFTALDNRKQQPYESVDDYYDEVSRLCRRVDPNISKQMILYFLQKRIREDMKANITRAMLTERDQTPETFLKLARIEEQLEQIIKQTESITRPYFIDGGQYYATTATIRPSESYFPRDLTFSVSSQTRQPNSYQPQQRTQQFPTRSQHQQPLSSRSSGPSQRYFNALQQFPMQQQRTLHFASCLVCGQNNHRTIDCFNRQPNGCFKCGEASHRVSDCPQIFD